MTTITKRDAIEQAMNLADDVAQNRLSPAELEATAVAELSALMLIEPEPGSDLAALRVEVARAVLAAGGIPADELQEWLAVARVAATTAVSSA